MSSLHASTVRDRSLRYARRALRAASIPLITALQPVAGLIHLRISYACSTPTAPEVIGNYARGLVLFGRSGARWVKFEWRSFPTRAVITRETAKVPKSLHRIQRRGELEARFDQDFEEIIRGCQEGRTDWMWITPAVIDVYREMRRLGFISTVGTYRDGRLVGGLWGIGIGDAFGLMSMFHREDHAGSLAMAALVNALLHEGRWSVIDFGVMTPNFSRYGAQEVSSAEFCEVLRSGVGAEMAGLASAGSAGLAGQRPHRRDPVR
jgi:leucyl/phenylalanyl-tRNA---protein transferase